MNNFGAAYRNLALSSLLLIVLGLAIAITLPFVPALLWGLVLSILMYPVYKRISVRIEKVKLLERFGPSNLASLATTLITFVIICIPFLVIALGIYVQVGNITGEISGSPASGPPAFSLEGVLQKADEVAQPLLNMVGAGQFSIKDYVLEHENELMKTLQAPAGRFAKQAAFTILTIVIALLSMFFMLRDGPRLREPAFQLMPVSGQASESIWNRLVDTVRAVFIGTVLVAVIQGTIMGITYQLVGLPNALLLGVFSIILCIVPLLGAPVLYIPMGLILLAQGDTTGALWILGVGFLVVSQIDNVLKPIFIGGRTNLHPLAIFFAVLGGVALIGPIGVMAGPMVLTLALSLVEVLRERVNGSEAQLQLV